MGGHQGEFYALYVWIPTNGTLVRWSIYTFIVLIPKIINLGRMFNLRLISSVKCMHKFLSKVLVNRLKLGIDKVIETKTTFVIER